MFSFGNSINGFRVLVKETAARRECAVFGAALIALLLVGATIEFHLMHLGLFAFVLCVEALNTAIEEIVDRVSPDISGFAKRAKDLGSFAVLCALLIYGGFTAFALWTSLSG